MSRDDHLVIISNLGVGRLWLLLRSTELSPLPDLAMFCTSGRRLLMASKRIRMRALDSARVGVDLLPCLG